MLLYMANPSTSAIRARMTDGPLGAIMSKAQGNTLPDGALYCVDNSCGPGKDGQPGTAYPGDDKYIAYLLSLAAADGADPCDPDTSRCLFAVAPDVLCDAEATLRRSRYMLPVIRHVAGLPAALVAQNGLEHILAAMSPAEADEFWADFDVLFLGGDDGWKLGRPGAALAAEARRRRKWVHMGRVNSRQRLRYASYIGCDSADGTGMTQAPDLILAQMLRWLGEIGGQLGLFGPRSAAGIPGPGPLPTRDDAAARVHPAGRGGWAHEDLAGACPEPSRTHRDRETAVACELGSLMTGRKRPRPGLAGRGRAAPPLAVEGAGQEVLFAWDGTARQRSGGDAEPH